jgi:hypothetical protein
LQEYLPRGSELTIPLKAEKRLEKPVWLIMEPEEASPSSLAGSPPQVAGMSGAAGYSIPVSVPPGRAGIAPSIAMTYSSSRGNGWMGVGWDLDEEASS